MLKNCLILCLAFISLGQIDCVLNPKVICYYESWYNWRENAAQGKMTTENIDSSLCTDIVYGYLGVTKTSEVYIIDAPLMVEKHDLENFSKVKGSAKALVAIGGSNLSPNLTYAVESEATRTTFTSSVISFLQTYHFDGITIDWTTGSFTDELFTNFAKLLEKLQTEFTARKYTLGITVAPHPLNFDVSKVNAFVDFITVQTYDLHGPWDKVVGYEAPLDWQIETLQDWFSAGASPNKLLMSIPFYGHTWILANPQETEPGAPASGAGKQGPLSMADGKLGYNEICTQLKESQGKGWDVKRDTEKASIYAVNSNTNTWITFEDAITVAEKARNATTEGYGGIVVQALSNEDFNGLCGEKYPLLKAINKGLNKEPVTARTRGPIVTTPEYIITADPNQICRKEGMVRDPKDCSVYHKCIEFFPGILSDEIRNCDKSQAYDEKTKQCVDKQLVEGCH